MIWDSLISLSCFIFCFLLGLVIGHTHAKDECDKLRNQTERLKEALRATDQHWFDPTQENFACIGCDCHCSQNELGHDSDCCVLIAHNALMNMK